LSISAFGDRVVKWLGDEELVIEPSSETGFTFLVKTYPKGSPNRSVSISQYSDQDKLMVSTKIPFGKDGKPLSSLLPPSNASKMLRELLWLLNSMPTHFQTEGGDKDLTGLTIFQPIYSDAFTKDKLMMAIHQVDKTRALVAMKMAEYLQPDTQAQGTVPPQAQQVKGAMGCPNCGAPLKEGARFCGKCGTKL